MVNQSGVNEGLRELALFAGAGGGILGGKLLGWRTVCGVERDAYAAQILAQRQNDGILQPFPIWSDVQSFNGKEWHGLVDVVSGGFPCQDISVAGKGAGITGSRSGMWFEMRRIICEIMPRYVYVENSPALTFRGLGVILRDLSEMGYYAEWGVISCEDVGGVHLRERIWIKATNTNSKRCDDGQYNRQERQVPCDEKRSSAQGEPERNGRECRLAQVHEIDATNIGREREQRIKQETIYKFTRLPWGEDVRGIEDLRKRSDLPEPLVRRISHDVAFGVDRLKAIGNGQVPRVASTAWRILGEI